MKERKKETKEQDKLSKFHNGDKYIYGSVCEEQTIYKDASFQKNGQDSPFL